jgi:hypothetical protein
MSEVTQEDLQYLPYRDANLGRIFTRDCKENIGLFIKEFKESEFGSRLLAEGLTTGTHLDQILEEAQRRFGRDDVNMQEFTRTAKSLWMAGDLQPETPEVASVQDEPDVERDRLGRPLSGKAKQWKRWQEWCNDPNTTMKEIQELRRTNAAFAEFYANQSAQERAGGVGDAAKNLLEMRSPMIKTVSPEVRQFADDYRHMTTEQLKKILSPAMVGAEAAAHYQQLFDQCVANGLI